MLSALFKLSVEGKVSNTKGTFKLSDRDRMNRHRDRLKERRSNATAVVIHEKSMPCGPAFFTRTWSAAIIGWGFF